MSKSSKDNDIAKIVCVGGSLEFDLCLSLTEAQFTNLNINFDKINSLKDLKPYNLSSLSAIISLNSSNFLFNSLLFINRANKTKSFVEYIVPFSTKYPSEISFMEEVVKTTTEKNFIFIEEFNLLNITPRITFSLKKINEGDDSVLESKNFVITEQNNYDESNGYIGDLYSGFNFDYDCSFLYTDVMELFKCKKDSYDEIHSFLSHVADSFPNTAICINYSGYFDQATRVEIELINSIGDLLSLTDIFIFEEKEVNDYFCLMKSLNERGGKETKKKINVEQIFIKEIPNNKKVKKIKIGLIIDEMKQINIIQQDPNSFLVLFHSKFDLNFTPKNIPQKDVEEYYKITTLNYGKIKAVFIGGFLSRLFNKKSFNTCYVAGNESVKRVIDLIRFNFDFPTESSFYEILVKKPRQKKKEDIINLKKENHFVLDCTNVITSKKKDYNPLYDQMCQSYFESSNNRNHLHKLGFINKKGIILQDPDKKVFASVKNKQLMNSYEKEKKKLSKIKENNEMMKIQLKNLANNKYANFKVANIDELMELSSVYNFDKSSNKKLPSVTKRKHTISLINNKNSRTTHNDLYYKEIKNSKFLTKNSFYHKKNNHSLRKDHSYADTKVKSNKSKENSNSKQRSAKSKEEFMFYEKESIDNKPNKKPLNEHVNIPLDMQKNDKEKYIDKDNFLSFLNSYEEKIKQTNTVHDM